MRRASVHERLVCLLGLFLIWGAFSPSRADVENPRSSLRGRVLDQNRAAIPGAKVLVEATGISAVTSAVTDQNGEF